jgi:hypothetical protein
MNVTLKMVNSQWYEMNSDDERGGWIVRAISDGWIVVERNPDSSFGTMVASGASMNEAIDNFLFPKGA